MSGQEIPPYVYDNRDETSLSQGDILKVDGQFREKFNQFYPSIKHPDGKDRYVLVLTQSCDLVRKGIRKPKIPHINLCLVRPLKVVIKKIIDDEVQPDAISKFKLLPRDAMDKLKDRLLKLLNNNDQKIHFFLPKKEPFKEDMIALLHMSFSFRTEHYDELLKNRILTLKPEFQAKLGHVISELYGRIATCDLFEFGWTNEASRRHIDELLMIVDMKQVPDESFIEYIREKSEDEQRDDIDRLIIECQASKLREKFQPLRREFSNEVRKRLIKLLRDPEKISELQKMTIEELSNEINNKILKSNE